MTSVRSEDTPAVADLFTDQQADSEKLPVPPLRLRRVYLHGVGPDGARFDPLDLDFTANDGAASRVLLSLTNTGGKSTLITLVCSLVVPASRAQVGGKNLGDYVLTGDTSHVVCEWEDSSTATRTVTGTVMEWKDGRRQPGHRQRSTTNMHRAWYLFRTGGGRPGIDDLPFVVDGRRLPYDKYLWTVTELMAVHPQAQWVVTHKQSEWTETLEQRTSIDPVLFSYQMRMNDSEAGAEKLLATFDSPDNVVRFFVAALNDDRSMADFTGNLAHYADLAADRPGLEALAGFGAQIAPLIDTVAQQAVAVETAAGATQRAQVAGGEHAGELENRIRQDQKTLIELEEEVKSAGQELAAARREYGQISDIRLQLQLEEARARLARAKSEVALCTEVADKAQQEAKAWQAVDVVLDTEVARGELDAAQRAYDAANADLAPFRADVTAAAAALAGRLDGLSEEAKEAANGSDARVKEAEEAETSARDAYIAAQRALDQANGRQTDITSRIRAADEAQEKATTEGWLAAGEQPTRCVHRWQSTASAARVQAEEEDRRAEAAEGAVGKLLAELDTLDDELVGLREAKQRDVGRLEEFDSDLVALAEDEMVAALLGGVPQEVSDISRAAELARCAAIEADGRAAKHERLATAARTELAHLDETGTAPTGPDVLAVLAVLLEERIGAVTGLEWIERNVVEAEARPRFIEAHPDLAGGVVVTDPVRFNDAVERLATAKLRIRTPVTITTALTVDTTAADSRPRHVVIPHRATWDREWAAATRAELERTVNEEGEEATQARASAARHRSAAALCSTFTERWKGTTRALLDRQSRLSITEVADADHRRADLVIKRDHLRGTAERCRRQGQQARRDLKTAERNLLVAEQFAAMAADATAARNERPAVERARTAAQKAMNKAEAQRKAATATITAELGAAARARSDREVWQRERDELDVVEAAPDSGGNLEVVRAAWKALRDELAAAERGMKEAEFLKRAKQKYNEAYGRSRRFEEDVLARAAQLATFIEASSRESLLAAQRRASTQADDARRDQLRAENERDLARDAVRQAAPSAPDRQNHVDLSNTPEWQPATPEDIPALLDQLEARNVELLSRRDHAEQAESDARELQDAVASDVEAFIDTLAMWSAEKVPTARSFSGTKEPARDQMRAMLKAHREAEKIEGRAREVLRDALARVRATANEAPWRELDAPAAVRVRSLPEADLVVEAPVLARRIRSMAESASGDLADLDTHRAILRDNLVALCREQRRLLRDVTRLSRLPSGLGDLTNSPAIKIRFEEAPDDEAAARLAGRVDSWATEIAANPKRAASAEVRARWLADAVRDTVQDRARAGAWSVEILKPRIDGKVVYCPPDRIPQEFSGGQVLTLAVLVYCALSGVRGVHRVGGARPAGTLILDNPFGAASAEALIEMQHRLAAHNGLQLVCATGLHDPAVVTAFTGPGSVIVKLRNDGDLRRNLSFLRLRSRIVDGLDVAEAITRGRDPAAPRNWVDATRYEIRR